MGSRHHSRFTSLCVLGVLASGAGCGSTGDATADGPAATPDEAVVADLSPGLDASAPPDLLILDLANPDLAMPDLASPDLSLPDLALPDLATPDLTMPDLAMADLATPDLQANGDMARGQGKLRLDFETSHGYFGGIASFASYSVGDLDGNGSTDVLASDPVNARAAVFLADGKGGLNDAVEYNPGFVTPRITGIADVDSDGKPDILLLGSGANGMPDVGWLKNQGNGTFAGVAQVTSGQPSNAAVGADVNGDQVTDLVMWTAGFHANVAVLLGKGGAAFGAPIVTQASATLEDVRVADFDGDRKLDLLLLQTVPGPHHVLSVLLGQGNGQFAAGVDTPTKDYLNARPIRVADLDGDGRADAALAESRSPSSGLQLFFGGANGAMKAIAPLYVGRTIDGYALGDFDGDGKGDVAVALDLNVMQLQAGDGMGGFAAKATWLVDQQVTDFNSGDVDPDGHLDLFFPSRGISVLRGGPNGVFHGAQAQPTGSFGGGPAAGDVDGDGVLDAVAGDGATMQLDCVRGLGGGNFSAMVATTQLAAVPNRVLLADFTGDGKVDAVVGTNSNLKSSLYPGNGDGTFGAGLAIAGTDYIYAPADMDGDGKLDLIGMGSLSVLYGKGDGTFAAPVQFAKPDVPTTVAGGDLDKDGTLDAVFGNNGANSAYTVQWSRGLGNRAFAAPVSISVQQSPTLITIADMNGDGVADVMVGPGGSQGRFTSLINQGGGAFKVTQYLGTGSLALNSGTWFADFDLDGVLDMVVTPPTLQVLLGAGDGSFAKPVAFTAGFAQVLAVPDLDRDGKPDILVVSGSPNTALRAAPLINISR